MDMAKKKLSDILAEEVVNELDRPGSIRRDGKRDPKEISPETMQARHDAAADSEENENHAARQGSSFKDVTSKLAMGDDAFVKNLGKIILHPQAGAFLDKVLGAEKMDRLMQYGVAAHKRDLKTGSFEDDFGNIIRELGDMFDEHIEKGFVNKLVKASFQIWNRNRDKLK